MDGWAILAMIVFLALYYLTKKRHIIFLMLSCVSIGVLIGLVLAVIKINQIFG